jgi:hypothetical protein
MICHCEPMNICPAEMNGLVVRQLSGNTTCHLSVVVSPSTIVLVSSVSSVRPGTLVGGQRSSTVLVHTGDARVWNNMLN